MGAKPHFRILGIPVRIEPIFWIVVALLGYQLGDARLVITWVGVVLVSILVHELGHAIALRIFGQSSSIVLHGFGGLTFSQRRLNRTQSIIVSVAGPLSALLLLGLPLLVIRDGSLGQELLADYQRSDQVFGLWPVVVLGAQVNVFWSFLNLLPIRPLDGGNVLTELAGVQRARFLSIPVGAAAAVFAYTYYDGLRFVAFFLGFLAFINFSEYRRTRMGAGGGSSFDVEGPPVPGGGGSQPGASSTGGAARGRPSSRRGGGPAGSTAGSTGHRPPMAPATAPAGLDPTMAESFVWNLLRRGDVDGARRTLQRANGSVSPFAAGAVAAAGGDLDPLQAAYLAAPAGPSNLVTATIAARQRGFEPFIRRLLAAGPAGVEACGSIQTHLHYAEQFGAAAQVGELLHQVAQASRAQVAFDVACAWSRAGDVDRALRWLQNAVDDGFAAPRVLDGEPDLEPVRAHPGWADLRSRLP